MNQTRVRIPSAGLGGMLRDLGRSIESDPRLDGLTSRVRDMGRRVRSTAAGDALSGRSLGHPLHPALTDLPIGLFTSATALDLLGGRRSRHAATRLVGLGLLSVVPTALAGLVDQDDIDDPGLRRVAGVHAALNSVASTAYLMSWFARHRRHHLRGMGWAVAGGVVTATSAYLGGRLAFGDTDVEELGSVSSTVAQGASATSTASAGLLIDVSEAAVVLGVPTEQVLVMIGEDMLSPHDSPDGPLLDRNEVLAVRLQGG